jgi:hypothetical protein
LDKTIIGVDDQNKDIGRMKYRNWIGFLLVQRGMGHIRPDWEHAEGFVYAAVSRGRWFVKCPSIDEAGNPCGGNIGIVEEEPFHFCPDCLNVANDFKPQQVIWGSRKDIVRLKKILAQRKDYRRRNYLPHLGETLPMLEAENKRYGWNNDGI